MKETTKRKITLFYSILLIILAAVLTVMSVMPIVTFKEDRVKYAMEYYSGQYTAVIDTSEDLQIGFKPIVDFAINITDALKVIRVQAGNERIEAKEAERLLEKIKTDKSFANSIRLFYAFGGLVDEDESSSSGSDKFGVETFALITKIFGILFLVCLIGVGIVYGIIMVIKFLIFLIKSLKHLKDDTDTDVDNRMDKFPFTAYTAMMVMFYMLYSVFAGGADMGLAIKGAMIVFLVVCTLRAAKTILFAEKDRVMVIVKQAITVVSIIAVVLLMFNFMGADLVGEYQDALPTKSLVQYTAELEKLSESASEDASITKAAEDAVNNTNNIYMIVVICAGLFCMIFIIVGAICAVERFANKKTKLKTGELVAYKAMIGLAVFLLIVAIVPTVLAAKTEDDIEKAYEKGQFKIWYTEYQEEGTFLNIEYHLAKEIAEDGDEELKELRKLLREAEGDEKEAIVELIKKGENLISEAKERVTEIETRAKRPTNCLIAGILFLIAEIAYLVVPKVMKKKEDDTPAEEAPAPAEEA